MRNYGDLRCGNCYKLHLPAAPLDLEHDWVHVDILAVESRTAAFRVLDALAFRPLLELHRGAPVQAKTPWMYQSLASRSRNTQ